MNKILIFLVISLVLATRCFFTVNEGEQAIVVQLGKVVSTRGLDSGIHFKIPLIQEVISIDRRILDVNSTSLEMISADQKRLIVNSYTKYKIVDPIKFYRSVRNERILANRLQPIIENYMRENIANVSLNELLVAKRNKVMSDVQKGATQQAKQFGVSIIDVRIKRTDLPEENSSAIFKRMRSDREKEARQIRATGDKEAKLITATADKDKRVIIAESGKNAQFVKAIGDRQAAAILNKGYGVDKEFFTFYRTMELYKNSLANKSTKLVLSTDDEILSFLKQENK